MENIVKVFDLSRCLKNDLFYKSIKYNPKPKKLKSFDSKIKSMFIIKAKKITIAAIPSKVYEGKFGVFKIYGEIDVEKIARFWLGIKQKVKEI